MNKPQYSADWFTNNELSQVTPMPEAWDRTSASATSNCSSKPSACPAVYKYLDSQSAGKARRRGPPRRCGASSTAPGSC